MDAKDIDAFCIDNNLEVSLKGRDEFIQRNQVRSVFGLKPVSLLLGGGDVLKELLPREIRFAKRELDEINREKAKEDKQKEIAKNTEFRFLGNITKRQALELIQREGA